MSDNVLIERTLDHFEAIRRKDLGQILSLYSQSEDLLVFVEGPRWATVGYDKVNRGWTDFINSSIALIGCEWVENLTTRVIGNAGFVSGISELKLEINGEPRTIRFRGTFVLENQQDGWKVIHEHFSQPAGGSVRYWRLAKAGLDRNDFHPLVHLKIIQAFND